jgi:hypothetical protein
MLSSPSGRTRNFGRAAVEQRVSVSSLSQRLRGRCQVWRLDEIRASKPVRADAVGTGYDISPYAGYRVAGNAIFTGRDEVTAEREVVVGSALIGKETLRMTC